MNLVEHVRIIWRRRLLVVLLSFLLALLVFARSSTLDEVYEASAVLGVTSGQAVAGQTASDDTLFLSRTVAEQATTAPLLAEAIERAELSLSVDEAAGLVDAEASDEVSFVTITARGASSAEAAALASGVAQGLVETIQSQQQTAREAELAPLNADLTQVEEDLAALSSNADRDSLEARRDALLTAIAESRVRPDDQLHVVAPARGQSSPVAPTPGRDAALALVVALVLNAELAVVLEMVSDRFNPDDLAEEVLKVTGLPVMAEIPNGAGAEVFEAFRGLRTNLMFIGSQGGVGTMAIVGATAGVGRSFIAAGIARAAARLEVPVLLIDADLHEPTLHDELDLSPVPGLTNIADASDVALVTSSVPGEPYLSFIPAGSPSQDPVVLLRGGLRDVLSLITTPELVVVDTPAASSASDATAIAAQCEATLVVVDATSSRRRAIGRLVAQLRQVGASPIGVVVNRVGGGSRREGYHRREAAVGASR